MTIKNAEQLENEILEALGSVKDDAGYVEQAREIGNLAGKAINLAKARLEYASIKKKLGDLAPKIRILE